MFKLAPRKKTTTMITENEFGMVYHVNKMKKFQRWYLISKYVYRLLPALSLFLIFFQNMNHVLIFSIVFGSTLLALWFSLVMRSQRDVNYHAAKIFNELSLNETFR